MTPYLTVLCITRAEPFARPFLEALVELADGLEAECVIAADGYDAIERLVDWQIRPPGAIYGVESRGYVESVLDYALQTTTGRYVLRVDDDERVNEPMAEWLRGRWYARAPHWSFRRLNLFVSEKHALDTALLWPDPQTRLSHRELAGGRYKIHVASPHGLGEWAPLPAAIEHHKFLVKPLEERRAIAARYEELQPGSGNGVFLPFSAPEDFYSADDLVNAARPVEEMLKP